MKHEPPEEKKLFVSQAMISYLADENLPKEQYRVLLKLLGKIDFDDYLTVSQTEMAKQLNMKQQNISKAIRALCERKIIIEGSRAGLNKTYRFNPCIVRENINRRV